MGGFGAGRHTRRAEPASCRRLPLDGVPAKFAAEKAVITQALERVGSSLARLKDTTAKATDGSDCARGLMGLTPAPRPALPEA